MIGESSVVAQKKKNRRNDVDNFPIHIHLDIISCISSMLLFLVSGTKTRTKIAPKIQNIAKINRVPLSPNVRIARGRNFVEERKEGILEIAGEEKIDNNFQL